MKPILGSLKDSEEMLKFMNELSQFSKMFSCAPSPSKTGNETQNSEQNHPCDAPKNEKDGNEPNEKTDEKNPQSPTKGIADDFIERCLQNYFKNR